MATNLLWTKADGYKRTESWDKLSATLNQIAKLQPNYISVWEFQAHNLSYNVSAEFDDYRSRYHWVKKGLEFLLEGTKYNQRNPRLFWSLGWFTGHKIGRSDEHVQFRRLFRQDTDFHNTLMDYVNMNNARGPDGYPDNWLVAYLWYLQSEAVVDKGVPVTWMRLDMNVGRLYRQAAQSGHLLLRPVHGLDCPCGRDHAGNHARRKDPQCVETSRTRLGQVRIDGHPHDVRPRGPLEQSGSVARGREELRETTGSVVPRTAREDP